MKKIYFIVTAAFLFTLHANSQSFNTNVDDYNNNGAQVQHTSNAPMILVQNPVKNVITLQISNPVSTQYEMILYNSNGAKINTTLYDHPVGVSTKTIDVANAPSGIYFLVITSTNYKKTLQVVITQ